MAQDVTLSAAVRGSLLSLQNTTSLIERTNDRLSSGLKVASAIDDPVAFFQAKTLNDRAFDFTEKKDAIDQGISSVSTALEGVQSIEALVRQLKGVSSSMKSATGSQLTDLITQFNDLRSQIGYLADDTTYQGVNLTNNTTTTLDVSFSDQSASQLTVNAVNIRQSGLGIGSAELATTQSFDYSAASFDYDNGSTITFTYQGSAQTLTATSDTISVTYGTISLSISVGGSGASTQAVSLSAGDTITVNLSSAANNSSVTNGEFIATIATASVTTAVDIADNDTSYIREGDTTSMDGVISTLDSALSTLRTNAQTLGSNVALLNTRLEFTQNYVNTLESGAGKLTLADINEEGANLLALQTRQQLGIQALSFAGQSDQGVLSLFR